MRRQLPHEETLARVRYERRSLDVPVFGTWGLPTHNWSMIYDDEKATTVIELAWDGDEDARAVLCEIAHYFVATGSALPPALGAYIAWRVLPPVARSEEDCPAKPKRRGRNVHTNFRRNSFIGGELLNRGFAATRNDATENECACSIVAKALARLGIDLSYHAVAKIWAEHGFLARFLTRIPRLPGADAVGRNSTGLASYDRRPV
jgi:hypothetical protein